MGVKMGRIQKMEADTDVFLHAPFFLKNDAIGLMLRIRR